jgi:hypothetical protein
MKGRPELDGARMKGTEDNDRRGAPLSQAGIDRCPYSTTSSTTCIPRLLVNTTTFAPFDGLLTGFDRLDTSNTPCPVHDLPLLRLRQELYKPLSFRSPFGLTRLLVLGSVISVIQ